MRRAAAGFLAVLALAASAAAQGRQPGASPLHLLDVPFVSQDELLCGGAAAAMLMRATGARGVYAEDFRVLVDGSAGGIHTGTLADAFRARGYRVRATAGTAPDVRRELAAKRPVLALIEDRPGRYHYVVVVGWAEGAVVFHDPARAPFIARRPDAFERAWARAGRWMLVVDAATPVRRAAPDTTSAPASAARDAATRAFVEQQYPEAARLAERAVESSPGDREAWRLLGASRYLAGAHADALDAWNHSGDPRIDLVTIEGLSRTPHRAVEHLLGLDPGSLLTRERLVRTERRLALLPSQQASRVSYLALPANLAEVRGAIVERPLVPSRMEWLIEGARVPISREVAASFANAASAGDRLTLAWRFWAGRPRVGLDFRFPSRVPRGVWKVSAEWQREHYAASPRSEARGAHVSWNNWVGGRARVSGGVGLARWADRGTAVLVDGGVETRPLNDRVSLEVDATTGVGSGGAFAATTGVGRWRHPTGSGRVFASASVAHASARTPMDRWPGAGAGQARPLLLRAHPLLDDGAIAGPVFGRLVTQGTLEAQRDVLTRGFMTLGLAAFADVARAWERADGTSSPLHADAGAGLRVRFASGHPSIRIDVARGLRDGRTALTAGWEVGWYTRRR